VDAGRVQRRDRPWIIEELKNIGCDTARSVVEIAPEELVKRTDLEEETVIEVLRRILKKELAK
jgi:N utilization substance protein A